MLLESAPHSAADPAKATPSAGLDLGPARLRPPGHQRFSGDWRAAYQLLRRLRAREASELAATESLADLLYMQWFHDVDGRGFRAFPSATAFRLRCEPAFPLQPARLLHLGLDAAEVQPAEGASLRLSHGLVHALPPQQPLRAGAPVAARLMAQTEQAGFWHLWSRPWLEAAPSAIRRYYFAARPGHEADLAAVIARNAPAAEPWYAKFLCGTHPRGRRDPALLYLPCAAGSDTPLALAEAAAALLCEQPVRLARRIARGVYTALDPGNGLSFGQQLSQAVADAALQPRALDSYWRFSQPLEAFALDLHRQDTLP
jgi:hypothetical protein